MFYKAKEVYNNYFFSDLEFNNNSNKLKVINNNMLLKLIRIILGDSIVNVNLGGQKIYQTSSYHLKKFLKRELIIRERQPPEGWLNQAMQAIKTHKSLDAVFYELDRYLDKIKKVEAEKKESKHVFSPLNLLRNKRIIDLNKPINLNQLDKKDLKREFNQGIDFLESRVSILRWLEKKQIKYGNLTTNLSDYFFQVSDDLDKIQVHYLNQFFTKCPYLSTDLDKEDYQDSIYLTAFLISLKIYLDSQFYNQDIKECICYKFSSFKHANIKNVLKRMEMIFLSVLEWNVHLSN